MEDDLKFFKIGRQPHLFWKMEDNLNPRQMEDDYFFFKIEDDIKNFKNGRRLQKFQKWTFVSY